MVVVETLRAEDIGDAVGICDGISVGADDIGDIVGAVVGNEVGDIVGATH